VEPPLPGTSIVCTVRHSDHSTVCHVTGNGATVTFEYSRTVSAAKRRVHLCQELERGSAELWSELQHLERLVA